MVFKGFLFEICENNYLRFLMAFILKYMKIIILRCIKQKLNHILLKS